jgi:oligoribonuclease
MTKQSQRLIWIDLEMTGLDPQTDSIIEIATVVTEGDLEVIAEGPNLAIHQSETVLEQMDDWNQNQHSKSGLLERVRRSHISTQEAEELTLEFLQKITEKGQSPMCGNSICQDRRFMARLMPDLEAHFSYRNLDVTSLKIVSHLWAPEVARSHTKSSKHLAREDIFDSIYELKHYKNHLLNLD